MRSEQKAEGKKQKEIGFLCFNVLSPQTPSGCVCV